MKATAQAPANIAFIKYWGKADEALRLPLNASFSMNLSGAYTLTTVEFSPSLTRDSVTLLGGDFSDKETARVVKGLDRIRQRTEYSEFARVVTKNTFPKGAGSAASASGFAALTLAGFAAAGVNLSEKELTIFARMGSGSACRSIPDGFVVWEKGLPAGRQGNDSDSSFAYSLYPHAYWDLRDILVIVDSRMKKVATSEGMEAVATSPHLAARLAAIPDRMKRLRAAMKEKNFQKFGEVIEEDCLDMHHVMQTQSPPLVYWNDVTRAIMDTARVWRKAGLPVYYTIDAGPNVHLLYEGPDEERLIHAVKQLSGIESIIVNKPAAGAHIVKEHLF